MVLCCLHGCYQEICREDDLLMVQEGFDLPRRQFDT